MLTFQPTQFPKGMWHERALRKGQGGKWGCGCEQRSLQLNQSCPWAGRSMMGYMDFLPGRFLPELSPRWHQWTIAQQDTVNKKIFKGKIIFSNRPVSLALGCHFCSNLTGSHWRHMLPVSLDLAAVRLRAKLTVIAF